MILWKMKDNTLIDVHDMTNEHISNVIKMLRSKGFVSKSDKECLYYRPTGDMACYYFEQEFDRIMSASVSGWIDIMNDELLSRGQKRL